MRVLHTSDWHLGQKLLNNDRMSEQALALDWLLEIIEQKEVDVLVVCGDIYQNYQPSNAARELYHSFLAKLNDSRLKHAVLIAGNHDLPAALNTTKSLLKYLDVSIITGVGEDLLDQLIDVQVGNDRLVIAAVPFLRDSDLRKSAPGVNASEREQIIKKGIKNHYDSLASLIREKYDLDRTCVIVTGHLYAYGSKSGENHDNIYLGDTSNIKEVELSNVFDYVALGHIHRGQNIDSAGRVRYSGTMIPLSFSEVSDKKSVTLLECSTGKVHHKERVAVPMFRKLVQIEGELDEVKEQLKKEFGVSEYGLYPWVDVVVHVESSLAGLNNKLHKFVEEKELELVSVRVLYLNAKTELDTEIKDLESVKEEEVFEELCRNDGKSDNEIRELLYTFKILKEDYQNILDGESL